MSDIRRLLTPIATLGLAITLSACSNVPDEKDATGAVRAFLARGGQFAGLTLPPSVGIKRVIVGECQDSAPLDGQYCAVNIVSEEMPLVGAIALPMTLRFVKREGSWLVFLN